MPVMPALDTQRQEDCKCTIILNYIGSPKSAWVRDPVRREGREGEIKDIYVFIFSLYIQYTYSFSPLTQEAHLKIKRKQRLAFHRRTGMAGTQAGLSGSI